MAPLKLEKYQNSSRCRLLDSSKVPNSAMSSVQLRPRTRGHSESINKTRISYAVCVFQLREAGPDQAPYYRSTGKGLICYPCVVKANVVVD